MNLHFKTNLFDTSKSNKKNQEQPTETIVEATGDPKAVDEAMISFMESLDKISEIQKRISLRTAAMDALFIRKFKTFDNVQHYLDFLKHLKLHDLYDEFKVDLNHGSLESIDAFCKSVLGEEDFEKEYAPVKTKKNENVEIEEDPYPYMEVAPSKDEKPFVDVAFKEIDKDSKEDEEIVVQFNSVENNDKKTKEEKKDVQEGSKERVRKTDRKGSSRNVQGSDKGSSNDSSDRPHNGRSRVSQASGSNEEVGENSRLRKVGNLVKKYIPDGAKFDLRETKYKDQIVSSYDLIVNDNNGVRSYTLDNGTIIPGRISLLCYTEYNNYTIAVPLIKKERALVKKALSSIYKITNAEFNSLYSDYYLPDITLYNNIDFTGANFLHQMSNSDKAKFSKYLDFVVKSFINMSGRNPIFRFLNFNCVDNFTLISDEKCYSPVNEFTVAKEIVFVTIEYIQGNVNINPINQTEQKSA